MNLSEQKASSVCHTQVGPAHHQASIPRLDGLEVYAQPKADLVKDAATAAEQMAGAVEAAARNLDSNLALAAVSLPAYLMAPKPAQTCSVYVLSQGLLTLTTLQHCLQGQCRHFGACSCRCCFIKLACSLLCSDNFSCCE